MDQFLSSVTDSRLSESVTFSWFKDWKGRPEESHDSTVKRAKADFVRFVKNTYRVLLSRGMKGCYVYFQDEETADFVRSRIDRPAVRQ